MMSLHKPAKFLSLALLATALCAPAMAQRETVSERLDRLERQLQGGGDDTLVELMQEVQQLQDEVRMLRGLVEDQAFEIESLRQSQRDQYLDLDRRLSGGASTDSIPTTQPASALPGTRTVIAPSRSSNNPPPADTGVAQTQAAVPNAAGGQPRRTDPRQADLGTRPIREANTGPVGTLRDPVEERRAYERAYDAVRQGRYADASRQLSDFLRIYPDGEYADNAQYWLGESYYTTRNYDIAIETFQALLSRFPASDKVPDARLKIGFAHYSKGDWAAAQAALEGVVSDYPGTPVARLAEGRLRELRLRRAAGG